MRASVTKLAEKKANKQSPQFHVVQDGNGGTGKIDLGGIAKASSKSSKSKQHPVMPVSNDTLALLEQFLQVEPQFKQLEKQSKGLKAQISPFMKADFFRHFAGSVPTDQTQIALVNNERVRLVFGSRYTSTCTDSTMLARILGPQRFSECIEEATELSLKLDEMPEASRQPFVNGVIELAQKLGITQGISAKQHFKPVSGFHESRLRVLTVDQNTQLDAVLPFTAYPRLDK